MPASKKNKSLTVTIPLDVYEFLDEIHWTERKELGQIFREGITEHAKTLGYKDSAK